MRAVEACKRRAIFPISVTTPVLVPSFSSRGFPYVQDIHQQLRQSLSKASLVSAYDICHKYLLADQIYASDVLFIDSGAYEARPSADSMEPYVDERPGKQWSLRHYRSILDDLRPLSDLVIVSYDGGNCRPLARQISDASALFAAYPEFASDFLCKPDREDSRWVDIDGIRAHLELLAPFAVLGITEKELGESLLTRCQSLLSIRRALHQSGMETPIHIFGCLDPSSVIAYFLCGADIFDGLAWLRYAFIDGLAFYHSSATVLRKEWLCPDEHLTVHRWLQNVEVLDHLMKVMSRFCETRSFDELSRLGKPIAHVAELVTAAGLVM